MASTEDFKRHNSVHKAYDSAQTRFENIIRFSLPFDSVMDNYRRLTAAAVVLLSPSISQELQSISDTIATAMRAELFNAQTSLAPCLQEVKSHVNWYSVLEPLFPALEEQFENSEEPVKEIPEKILNRKPLTLEQLYKLLGAIATIIGLILQIASMQPDSQEAKQIQQNDILIEQGNIQIEQNKRIIELLEEQNSRSPQYDFESMAEDLLCAAENVVREIEFLTGNKLTDKVKDSAYIADDSGNIPENPTNPPIDKPDVDRDNQIEDNDIQ